jgi:hypothetical protein
MEKTLKSPAPLTKVKGERANPYSKQSGPKIVTLEKIMKEEERWKDISPPDLKISSAFHTVAKASAKKLEEAKTERGLEEGNLTTSSFKPVPYLRTEKDGS